MWYHTIRKNKGDTKMINIRSILKLKENDGLTLKAGKAIVYKSGWQVATEGIETTSAREAMEIGRACKQISVLGWRKMNLAYC